MSSIKNCQKDECLSNSSALPDIANEPHSGPNGKLDWVGMSGIDLPVFLTSQNNTKIQVLAHVQAYVNLIEPKSKGIHMSRLYIALDEQLSMSIITPAKLSHIIEQFIESHKKLSTNAYLECRMSYYTRRKSLISDNTGWKNYPIRFIAMIKEGKIKIEMTLELPYSSTCPCSAALARQIIQQGFNQQFGDQQSVDTKRVHQWLGTTEGISATPHSQRSVAQIRVTLDKESTAFNIDQLIDSVEDSLKTPVQAAVKREDEQEFARLNAANLMFCEDAARRLQTTLLKEASYIDFWLRINHMESLHPHNAVAIATKGVKGGYKDDPREFPLTT